MKICIIGGGTAGWWCAAYMQKFLDAEITLIESDEIPTSGVGESSLPQIGTFFEELGIPEKEWDEGVNKAVDKHYGSKYDKAKTDKCHTFVEALVPNGAERVKKVVQTLY